MKRVKDGEVPSRCYYYLLEWKDNEEGRKHLMDAYGLEGISQLPLIQFWGLFEYVTRKDLQNK